MIIRGIDTLEFGIDIINYNELFENFLLELDRLKILGQEAYKEPIIKLNNTNLTVKKKGQGFYAYKLECDDFHMCFMKHSIENSPPIQVRFISSFLWKYGYKEAFNVFINWFNVFGIKISGIRISRLDICLDTDEICFLEDDNHSLFCRARKKQIQYSENCVDKKNYIGKHFSGFSIGFGSPLSCRIYDKTLEIIKSSKTWFKTIWLENHWDCSKNVWRIEFQIRRKVLKELGIFNFEDIEKNLEGIWAYLTQKWLTLRIKNNNKNSTRFELDNRWIIIQKSGNDYISSPSIREVIRKGNLEKILAQCGGLITSISAITNEKKPINTCLRVIDHIREKCYENNTTFEKEVEKRKNKYIQYKK